MSNQILNTASLTFEYGSQTKCVFSNTASANLLESLSLSAESLNSEYFCGDYITYIINVKNNSSAEAKNLKITDNLGCDSSRNQILSQSLPPLNYESPSYMYINGNFESKISPEVYSDKIVFGISSIPANSNLTVIYKSVVNQHADMSPNSKITSTITLESENSENVSNSKITLNVSEKADIQVVKNMSAEHISVGEEITYNFYIYNYGNAEALNVTLTDTFSPAPKITSVRADSKELSPTDYSYSNGVVTIPGYASYFNLNIPAAKFIKNPDDGTTAVNPGITKVSITGKI